MAYRDDRVATRARVEELEHELANAKEALTAARASPPKTPPATKLTAPAVALAASLLLFAAAGFAGFGVSGSSGEAVAVVLALAGASTLALALSLFALASLVHVVPPNQLAVVSGRMRRLPDGTSIGYRLVRSGRVLRMPVVEAIHFMDLGNRVVPVRVLGCLAKGGALVDVEATANVKVAGELPLVTNAVERFLEADRAAVSRVAEQIIEAALRGAIAGGSIEEAAARRDELGSRVFGEAKADLEKLGLVLDSLKILTITAGRRRDPIPRGS